MRQVKEIPKSDHFVAVTEDETSVWAYNFIWKRGVLYRVLDAGKVIKVHYEEYDFFDNAVFYVK